jgi:hypothetical protein
MPSHAELSISGYEKISAAGSVSRGDAHTATRLKPDCCNEFGNFMGQSDDPEVASK